MQSTVIYKEFSIKAHKNVLDLWEGCAEHQDGTIIVLKDYYYDVRYMVQALVDAIDKGSITKSRDS
jgi:hypothetical protein